MAVDTALTLPAPLGSEYATVTLVKGIANYSSSAHQTVSAQSCRLNTVKFAVASGLTTDGSYYVQAAVLATSGATTIQLRWYAVGGSTEANSVDLSGKYIALLAIGN